MEHPWNFLKTYLKHIWNFPEIPCNTQSILVDFGGTFSSFCQTPVLGQELGVDFIFAWDNNNNNDNNKNLNLFERNSTSG